MGAPPPKPILLFGFDFPTQNLLRFDLTWSAAFLTPKYTDEDHRALRDVYRDDYEKKREVKYGNNIALLFYAMIHLGESCGEISDDFWVAIARGFNTNSQLIHETADILTEARRVGRSITIKKLSETAKAADDWIDFLDHRRTRKRPRPLSLNQQIDIVVQYLQRYEGRQVNAANVPLDSRIRPIDSFKYGTTSRMPPSVTRRVGSASPPRPRPHPHLHPSVKDEHQSPVDAFLSQIPREPRAGRKRSASPISATRSPAQKRPHREHEVNNHVTPVTPGPMGSHNLISPQYPTLQRSNVESDETAALSRQLLTENNAAQVGRVEAPEVQLAPGTADGRNHRPTRDEGSKLQNLKDVLEVVMKSINPVADNPQPAKKPANKEEAELGREVVSQILQPIRSLDDRVRLLGEEVANSKIQAQQEQGKVLKELKMLMTEQSNRMNSLVGDVAQMQATLVGSPVSPGTTAAQPLSLRQALAGAEHDLRYHLHTVSQYYHRQGAGTSRIASEKVTDLLLALEEGVTAAVNALKG
jgi:hypothetical protein